MIASALLTFAVLLAAPPVELALTDPVVIEDVRQGWRRPIHRDAVEFAWVTGVFDPDQPIAAGDYLPGTEQIWSVPEDKVTSGGWLHFTFDSDEAYDAILEPGPGSIVFVNGEPRAGDTYANGMAPIPFRVREGYNTVMIQSGRGAARPVVRLATTPVSFWPRDRTLPNVRRGVSVRAGAGLILINASDQTLSGLMVRTTAPDGTVRLLPVVGERGPYSAIKVEATIEGAAPGEETTYPVFIEVIDRDGAVLAHEELSLPVRAVEKAYKQTFRSQIDGTVQYFGVRPPKVVDGAEPPDALIVTLHGASVEGMGQARCYPALDWATVVAPTNRRPFGFDWEDWGRVDFLEVMHGAIRMFDIDPARVYLTGHSMGGHGTWINGLTYAPYFAGIAPSAGWASFWTYAERERFPDDGKIGTVLRRAANVSDTMLVADNAAQTGVYVLHGDADDNVPVREARAMRQQLGSFHPDFTYYERPGAGHWWGNQCVAWPPLLDFLQARQQKAAPFSPSVDLTVVDPHLLGLDDLDDTLGVRIDSQQICREPSRVVLRRSVADGTAHVSGTTTNVLRMRLRFPDDVTQIVLELDGDRLELSGRRRVELIRGDQWTVDADGRRRARLPAKDSRRGSGFKSVLLRGPSLVYATGGTDAENEWALAKARYDAETFRYRGNGRLQVISDVQYLNSVEFMESEPAVLYGHADANLAYADLLAPDGPIEVRRDALRIGEKTLNGPEHAAVFLLPAKTSVPAGKMIGVVAGTGLPGMRTTTLMPFFLSGAHWPDWLTCTPEVLDEGWESITGCGFFDNDWNYDAGQSAWR